MKVRLTKHAYIRVTERLIISPSEVIRILTEDKVVPLGYGHGTKRLHKLFYSEADNAYFVAVHDMANGDVVTILPHNYHNAFPISLDAQQMAKDLVCPPPAEPIAPPLPKEEKPKGPANERPKSFKAVFYDRSYKKHTIAEWPCADFNWDMIQLLESPAFGETLRKALQERKDISWMDSALIVMGRHYEAGISIRLYEYFPQKDASNSL